MSEDKMVNQITVTTQLDIFDIVRDILRNNSDIASRFSESQFYEFEPNPKSSDFKGYPIIIIEFPQTKTDLLTINHKTTFKEFTANLLLRMDYEARSKFGDYANLIISQIESSESSFETYGYFSPKIELTDTSMNVIDQKKVVEGTFSLQLTGVVNR